MKNVRVEPSYVPVATYRLQLNGQFRFSDAAELVPYLSDLGITDCYLSPFLQARPGSLHGYDVVNHANLNPEIGDLGDLLHLSEELRKRSMGIIADVVPNHMCIASSANLYWQDLLENGPSSPFARYFDVDWNPPKTDLTDKVLLPVLGNQFGEALESGELQLVRDRGGFAVNYYELRYPVSPRTWPLILEPALETLRERLGPEHLHVQELESILTAISYLPPRTETDEVKVRERLREKEVIRRRLTVLESECPEALDAIEESLRKLNGTPGDPSSFDGLERVLDAQAYRLAYWRVAADEINYRRFFDINELAAIRVEDPEVFAATHRLLLELVQQGHIRGLRIDHPDGLFEPPAYFDALREAVGWPIYVVAEKILTGDEQLRPWTMEGTTGYGAMNVLNGLLVDGSRKKRFLRLHRVWRSRSDSYEDVAYESKRLILQVAMSSELNVLSRRLDRISEFHRRSRDFTLENLRDALREIVACFPIYRTYLGTTGGLDEVDSHYVRIAVAKAKGRNRAMNESVFDFIQSVLLLEGPAGMTEEQQAERRLFVMRLQQFTAPVMAKGVEDTVFYRYHPLASLNEVGGNPQRFGCTPALFHQKNRIRAAEWPYAMVATSTHDTKRSEDARARISALSEIPKQWFVAAHAWRGINEEHKSLVGGVLVPGPEEEYLFYQTLVGVWPMVEPGEEARESLTARVAAYMEKAVREAKVHTSWINPNQDYEAALSRFVHQTMHSSRFLAAFQSFHQRIAYAGVRNSLTQVVLKTMSPGTPDFYQGSELWDFSLVDPDNRRPVDYQIRRRLLREIDESPEPADQLAARLLAAPEDGAIKLWVTSRALRFRRDRREFFQRAGYTGLNATGPQRNRVVAFARSWKREKVIVAASRFFLQEKPWTGSIVLPRGGEGPRAYRDILTGRQIAAAEELPLAEVFGVLPVAILEGVIP